MPRTSSIFALVLILCSFVWIAPPQAHAQQAPDRVFTGSVEAPHFMQFQPTVGDPGQRVFFTITLLRDGHVLLAGGGDLTSMGRNGEFPYPPLASAVLYLPDDGWVSTGSMHYARKGHTATLLPDGKVRVAGGCRDWEDNPMDCPSEVYDPVSGTWGPEGSLLALPATSPFGEFSGSGPFSFASLPSEDCRLNFRYGCIMPDFNPIEGVSLANGKNLGLLGYWYSSDVSDSARNFTGIYDEEAFVWRYAGELEMGSPGAGEGAYSSVTLLLNGQVLVMMAKQHSCCFFGWIHPQIGAYSPANSFTGTLSLPTKWLTSTTTLVSFSGLTTGTPLVAGELSNSEFPGISTSNSSEITVSPGVTVTVPWQLSPEEQIDKPVYLRLYDSNGQFANVVSGTVALDMTPPSSSIQPLPQYSSRQVALTPAGSDTLSGIASYDVRARRAPGAGDSGDWAPVVTQSVTTSVVYTGEHGVTYQFQVRAHDVAGNVEAWHDAADTETFVDGQPPTGTVVVNRGATTQQGAIDTASSQVVLALDATDDWSDVKQVRTRVGTDAPAAWVPFSTYHALDVGPENGLKTVSVEYMDAVGNISRAFSDTIRLDTSHGSDYGIEVNEDALWTNSTEVTLTIPAAPGTAEMQVSNGGAFSGAEWEPYRLYRDWEITAFGTAILPRLVYVRFRDSAGTTSHTFQDDIILDQGAPTSSVALAAQTASSAEVTPGGVVPVAVQFMSDDDLSGIKGVDVQVQTAPRGLPGLWQDWLVQTTATEAVYYAQADGIVSFRSRALDNAGNWEQYPAVGDATVTVGDPPGGFRLFLPHTANP